MKTIYAFAFFVSMLSVGVVGYGQDTLNFALGKTPYRVSLAAGAGILWGQTEEIVYKDANTDVYLSQLLWDLKPLVYLGGSLSLARAEPLAGLGATLDMAFKLGLPLASGIMEDRDWTGADPDQLTNFSSHDAALDSTALLLDFSGGISIPLASRIVIRFYPISLSFMQFSWKAKDGYREYASESWARIPMEGTLISYDQRWLIISPGLGLSWPAHRQLGLDFRFFISPLIFASDEDTHVITKTRYRDAMPWSFHSQQWRLYVEPALAISFSPNRYLSLVAHGSWRYITGVRGDTTQTAVDASSSTTITSKGMAGASYSALDVGLSFKFALPLGLRHSQRPPV